MSSFAPSTLILMLGPKTHKDIRQLLCPKQQDRIWAVDQRSPTYPGPVPHLFHTLALEIWTAGELAWNRARSDSTGELMKRGLGRRNEPILQPWRQSRAEPSDANASVRRNFRVCVCVCFLSFFQLFTVKLHL